MKQLLTRSLGAGAAAAGAYALAIRPRLRRYGATREEAETIYPGDDLIPDADTQTTMAVTLPAPPEAVWPWLVQMGSDRAGWYSWDRLDHGGRPSAEQIVPQWQDVSEGDRMITTPNGATWFTVAVTDPPHDLVLRADLDLLYGRSFNPRGPLPRAYTDGIWAFHLRPLPDDQTRLIVRTRGRVRPRPLGRAMDLLFGEPAHFIMQIRQFQNLRARVGGIPAERQSERVGWRGFPGFPAGGIEPVRQGEFTMPVGTRTDSAEVRQAVLAHQENCLPDLARLRLAAMEGSAMRRVAELQAALEQVLGQMRAAERHVVGIEANPLRRMSLTRFLGCRLKRLDVASDDVLAAVAGGDVAAARRHIYRFHALATALWQVQLGILTGRDGGRFPAGNRRRRGHPRLVATPP